MANMGISLFNAFLMLILIIFWGGSFVVVKIALREGLTPIAVATFRFLIAGGLFIVVLLLKKAKERDYRLLVDKKDAPTLLFLALAGITFMFTAQYTGIQMAGADIAAIFVCLLSPIFVAVFSVRMFKERLTKKQIFGMGVAATGTFTIITGGSLGFTGNSKFLLGSLILLSTPVLWAAYSLLGKKTTEKYNPFLVVAYVTILGGLCLIPFSLAENSLHLIFTMNLQAWLAVLFLSLTCSLFGYYIWMYMLKKAGATVTS
jgi:drug/metabolite transporter (DMT)-like permease